jgi:hypothetical protein
MIGDFWVIIASYFAVFIAVIFLLNFLTRGFIWIWLRVLLSRGKLILVQVRNPIQNYWITGRLEADRVIVKDREAKSAKAKKNLMLQEGVVYRSFGVNVVYYDEATNELLKPNLENVAGADLLKTDSLMTRCLYKPQSEEDKKFRMLVYIGLGVCIVIGVLIYFKVDELAKLLGTPAIAGGVLNGFIGFRIRK